MRERIVYAALSVCVLLMSACAEPTGQSWIGTREEAKQEISPLCLPGCTETDPFPSWPGVFLTSAVTPDECTVGNDIDLDDLSDRCENDISQAFSPELYFYNGDYVGREPYWVARLVGQKVKIGYLLSYYRDEGSSNYLCSLPGAPSSCHGHNGDSEAIFLIVYYDAAHKHWILDEARSTQHGDHVSYPRGSNLYPKMLKYPGKLGAYPRSYVAEGKHANYGSLQECNGGGEFGTDTCERVNTGARVAWSAYYNLRSRTVHNAAQDCIESRNPNYVYYGSGRKECFWTGSNFRGWVPTTVGGATAGSYSTVLANEGF